MCLGSQLLAVLITCYSRFYESILQLPMGKVTAIWQIFLDELTMDYIPHLITMVNAEHNISAKRGKKEVMEIDTQDENKKDSVLKGLSQVVYLFVAYIDSVLLVNANALSVLDLVNKTCNEIICVLLSICLQAKIHARQGHGEEKGKARNDTHVNCVLTSVICDMMHLYNALLNIREQCLRFPSTHNKMKKSSDTVSDDIFNNPSCFHLLQHPGMMSEEMAALIVVLTVSTHT